MTMKHNVSGNTYNIAKIFVDDTGHVKVLYFDAQLARWMTESINYFTPVE